MRSFVVAVPRDTPREIEPCGAARAVGEAAAVATDKRDDLLGGELDVADVAALFKCRRESVSVGTQT